MTTAEVSYGILSRNPCLTKDEHERRQVTYGDVHWNSGESSLRLQQLRRQHPAQPVHQLARLSLELEKETKLVCGQQQKGDLQVPNSALQFFCTMLLQVIRSTPNH